MNIKDLKKKWQYKKAAWRFKNRSITRAKVLYWYFIFGGIGMFLYAISCLFTGFPFKYAFSPVVILIGYFLLIFLKKNWNLVWMYIKDMEQGRLLMYLDRNTHYSEEHKIKLLDWVYLPRKTIRNERWLKLSNRVREGKELSRSEKKEIKFKVATCPQQLLDGINKAILVSVLIHAHTYIQILDDNLREILELTDKNMNKFNLQDEINRCKTKDERDKINKYKAKGMEIIKNRKND